MVSKASKENSPIDPKDVSVKLTLCGDGVLRRVVAGAKGSAELPQMTWSLVGKNNNSPWQGTSRDEVFNNPRPLPDENEVRTGSVIIRSGQGGANLKIEDVNRKIILWSDHRRGFFRSASGMAHWWDRGDEYIFGLGEKTGELNRKFRRYRMRNTDALGYDAEHSDPLYKHWPFFIVKNPQSPLAVGVFYDQSNDLTFDFGCEIDNYFGPYNSVESSVPYFDQYFIIGESIAEVVAKFSKMIGGHNMPPRWSLGHLASTMQYTEAENPQIEIKKFIERTTQEQIPCSAFHFSSGYSLFDKKRFVFEWNEKRIQDPEGLIKTLHDAKIASAVNVKPCLLEGHPKLDSVTKQKLLVGQARGEDHSLKIKFWDSDGYLLDFSNPMTVAWWKRQVKSGLLEKGVDCVWNDNNEFNSREVLAGTGTPLEGFGSPMCFEDSRPILTLLMVKASYEAQQEYQQNLRPMQITRSGMPGIQRYASTWTGDNFSSWKALKFSIPIGLGLSLSGYGNFGHDVGGFAGPAPSPELLLRWVQMGIFQPRFCIHSWNSDGTATEPWMYSENKDLIRAAILRRYELLPYLYHLMFQLSSQNEPINRPLFYDFPDDEQCYARSFEFMLGPQILVAPVYEPGVLTRQVYLPKDTRWYSLQQKKWIDGGQLQSVPVTRDQIPTFVRDGSIIPLSASLEGSIDRLDTYMSDQMQSTVGEIYQDDGVTMSFRTGAACVTQVKVAKISGQLEVQYSFKGDEAFGVRAKCNLIT